MKQNQGSLTRKICLLFLVFLTALPACATSRDADGGYASPEMAVEAWIDAARSGEVTMLRRVVAPSGFSNLNTGEVARTYSGSTRANITIEFLPTENPYFIGVALSGPGFSDRIQLERQGERWFVVPRSQRPGGSRTPDLP